MILGSDVFAKVFDEDLKIGVIVDLAPQSVQEHLHLNAGELKTFAQVRRVFLDYVEAAGDRGDLPTPMDVSALEWKGGKGGKGSKGKNDKKFDGN